MHRNTNCKEIYLHSLPIKEYQIVDYFLPKLKDEVMKVRVVWVSGSDSRSVLCRNRLALVNVPASRLSSSSATVMATSVSA